MGPALQKMQDDDTANPAMLFVQAGASAWAKSRRCRESCADCHGDAASMKGVAARYPALAPGSDKPIDLEGRINLCRTTISRHRRWHRKATGCSGSSLPRAAVARPADRAAGRPKLAALRRQGADLFKRRQGQLNLSCANCHDDNAGRKLAGATIPQAHPTGYPIYRLEWQALGSLRRRLRNCLVGMRAETWQSDATEYLALESYLMERARGMAMDAPAVRP